MRSKISSKLIFASCVWYIQLTVECLRIHEYSSRAVSNVEVARRVRCLGTCRLIPPIRAPSVHMHIVIYWSPRPSRPCWKRWAVEAASYHTSVTTRPSTKAAVGRVLPFPQPDLSYSQEFTDKNLFGGLFDTTCLSIAYNTHTSKCQQQETSWPQKGRGVTRANDPTPLQYKGIKLPLYTVPRFIQAVCIVSVDGHVAMVGQACRWSIPTTFPTATGLTRAANPCLCRSPAVVYDTQNGPRPRRVFPPHCVSLSLD